MTKKLILSIVASAIVGVSAVAQAPKIYKMNLSEIQSPSFTMPYTTVKMVVVVERESIRKGPYARFAQKYLGVMAPLADKEIYTIQGVKIGYADPDNTMRTNNVSESSVGCFEADRSEFNDLGINPILSPKVTVSHSENDSTFVKVAPDRTSTIERSPEEMAKDAAEAIFTLRKRRFDLVTGEAGENVFGAGLQSALAEIGRLEQEYLSLFLGKQTLQKLVKEYDVVPEKGKTSYIVARFSPTTGILSDSDLSGRPLVLILKAEGSVSQPAVGKRDSRPLVYYRVADFVNCRFMDATTELAKARIPIYQFGVTIEVPVSPVK